MQTARYIFVNLESFIGKKNPENIEQKVTSIDIEVQIVSKFKWTFLRKWNKFSCCKQGRNYSKDKI